MAEVIVTAIVAPLLSYITCKIASAIGHQLVKLVEWIKKKVTGYLNSMRGASENDKCVIKESLKDATDAFVDKMKEGVQGKLEDQRLESEICRITENVAVELAAAA